MTESITQETVDRAMTRLGCEVREYGGGRNPGGKMCATHAETWWYEGGASGCKRAYAAARAEVSR